MSETDITRNYGVGNGRITTMVFADPVSLNWTWRGYSEMSPFGIPGPEFIHLRDAKRAANAWARREIKLRIAAWSRALSEVGQ